MPSGALVEVRIDSDGLDACMKKQLASTLDVAVKVVKNSDPAVMPKVLQYQQSSLKFEKSDIKHQIQQIYWSVLEKHCPPNMLAYVVKLLTKSKLRGFPWDSVHASSIVLCCRVVSVEALLDLKQMIDSGRLSRLFSDMFTVFANTSVTAVLSLSAEEYEIAYAVLIYAAGKNSVVNV